MSDWNLVEEVGGPERFEAMIRDFYDRLFDDVLVGFLFQPHDKDALVASQMAYLSAHLGDRSGTYEGRTIRAAHDHVPVLGGHFDRRHHLLEELLDRWDVPSHVADEWLALDASLRDFVVNMGAARRDQLLGESHD